MVDRRKNGPSLLGFVGGRKYEISRYGNAVSDITLRSNNTNEEVLNRRRRRKL